MIVQLDDLESAIRESWDKSTCYPLWADIWTPDKPALGQCGVTALIIQDYLAGDILYCIHRHHYWNKLPNQREVDLTRHQFPPGVFICRDEIKSRDYLLHSETALKANTPQRYKILKQRVEDKLSNQT